MTRVSVFQRGIADEKRREIANRCCTAFDRERILIRQRRHRQEGIASGCRKVGNDANERRADVLELIRDLELHPLHKRYDSDDGSHADHDAEDREDRAHLVCADCEQRNLEVFEEHPRASLA